MKILLTILTILLLNSCNGIKKLSASEISISGTQWLYSDNVLEYKIDFNKNGKITTTHPNDKTPDNDSWTQSGGEIYFQFNDGFSKYNGRMKSMTKIRGKASSENDNWNWTLTKIQ